MQLYLIFYDLHVVVWSGLLASHGAEVSTESWRVEEIAVSVCLPAAEGIRVHIHITRQPHTHTHTHTHTLTLSIESGCVKPASISQCPST